MADPPRHPDTSKETARDRGSTDARPRWVIALAILSAVALVVLLVVLHLTGTLGPGAH
jgi:hypothetical protein